MSKTIYDNSNIAESYAGVTTPLTFSFVRYVYQEVYKFFSKMMGASAKSIRENEHMFEHMVEFIGYSIYYNLSNWYKMLSFFPGYKFSSEFMEKMMGVDEKYRSNNKTNSNSYKNFLLHTPKTILQAVKICVTFLFLPLRMSIFNKYFDKVYSELDSIQLSSLSLRELRELYDNADAQLLSKWRVPIANDFAVMVSTGLADKLFSRWLDSKDAYTLMHSNANMPLISLDPGNRVIKIVGIIIDNEEFSKLFIENDPSEIRDYLYKKYAKSVLTEEIDGYLRKFGTRMPNELKLESRTLVENPESFILLLKSIVEQGSSYKQPVKVPHVESNFKKITFLKRQVLHGLMRWAGNSILGREEARFRRALIFGYIRKIFVAIGKTFEQKRILKSKRDIFYLKINEIFDLVEGKEDDFDVLTTIKMRKKEFTKWKGTKLSTRFETNESISEIEQQQFKICSASTRKKRQRLAGRVASRPGNTRHYSGIALTLKDFDPTASFEGRILVACQTDPGWTLIFPLLKGIVVERGGMLSHAAIVARELNIPCIVGVENATDFIVSGTEITIDLQEGFVKGC